MKIAISTALIRSMRKYDLSSFLADLKAGFVVSLVALPLSMALSIAVGLPPQHGIYTAIVAGIIAPLLGGSKFQVSGPTAAFIVILAPIVSEFGLRGLIWCQIMAGLVLLILGLTRSGKFINYVPYPVTTGFTAGIAIVILTLSLKDFMGLNIISMPDSFIDKLITLVAHLDTFSLPEFGIALLTLLLIIYGGKATRLVPSPILGIGAATIAAVLLHRYGIADIITIADKFSYTTSHGKTLSGIPPYPPHLVIPGFTLASMFRLPGFDELRRFAAPSLIIAALAALESLLSATVADSLSGKRHDPNAELNGIGIANILSGMASGIPATGAIARTAANIQAGARSPLAASFHALFILLYVLLLSRYVNMIPMASLAALLFITACRMSHVHQVISVLRSAPAHDKIVLLACMLTTTFIDMVAGVTVGIVLASILFMKRISELTDIELENPRSLSDKIMAQIPSDTFLFRIQGAFFFGNAEKAFDRTALINDRIKHLILDLRGVSMMDVTGMVAVRSIIDKSLHHKISVSICAHKPLANKLKGHLGEKYSGRVGYFPTLQAAIEPK